MAMQRVRKARRKLGRGLLTRTFFFVVLLALQILMVCGITWALGRYSAVAYMFLMAFSVLAVVTLLDKDRINPVYKLMWVTIITMMPPMGALFYLFWGHRNTNNRHARRMEGISGRITRTLPQDPEPLRRLRLADQGVAVVVLSNEAQEIIRVCDRALVLYHGDIQAEVKGETMNEHEMMRLATGG